MNLRYWGEEGGKILTINSMKANTNRIVQFQECREAELICVGTRAEVGNETAESDLWGSYKESGRELVRKGYETF